MRIRTHLHILWRISSWLLCYRGISSMWRVYVTASCDGAQEISNLIAVRRSTGTIIRWRLQACRPPVAASLEGRARQTKAAMAVELEEKEGRFARCRRWWRARRRSCRAHAGAAAGQEVMQLHATDAYNSCHSCNIRAGQCNSERLKCRCRE